MRLVRNSIPVPSFKLRDVFRRRKVRAIVQGFGPMFQVYFTERDAIYDYRDYCSNVGTFRSRCGWIAQCPRTRCVRN